MVVRQVPVITAPAQVCSNGSVVQLAASLTPGTWKVDGSPASKYFDPKVLAAGAHSITYTYTDSNSCVGVASASININLKTTPSITPISNVCINATGNAALVAAPTGGVWKLDGGSNSGSLALGTLAVGNHDVKYIYTDANSCIDTANTTFTVYDTTQVNIANAQYCQGTSYTYTLPNNWQTYTWNNVLGSNSFTVSGGTQAVTIVVVDANGCSTQDVAAVTENPYPTPDLGNDIEMCFGDYALLDPGTANSLVYSWTPGNSTTPTLTVNTAGTYIVSVEDNIGCVGKDTVEVIVHALPQVSLGADTSLCDNGFDRIYLHASYTGNLKLLWSTYEKNLDSIKIGMVGEYWIQVTDANTCVNRDTIVVVHKCPDYKFTWPKVFTPNADGFNEEFLPKDVSEENFQQVIANMLKLEFEVYNRWGIKVYESTNVIPRWDGRFNGADSPAGTYYWLVRYTNTANKVYEDKGFVQLIR